MALSLPLVCCKKPTSSAEVIIVTMAKHEGIQLVWLNGQQTGVVVECLMCEAEILSFPKIPSGLDLHRKAESSHH